MQIYGLEELNLLIYSEGPSRLTGKRNNVAFLYASEDVPIHLDPFQ